MKYLTLVITCLGLIITQETISFTCIGLSPDVGYSGYSNTFEGYNLLITLIDKYYLTITSGKCII